MRAAAILNPHSSPKLLREFQAPGIELVPLDSPQPGFDCVLLFGGDGTVHRHLPALLQSGVPLLVVPAGSGNDFARGLGLKNREASLSGWKRFCAGAGNLRRIDVGVITPAKANQLPLAAEAEPRLALDGSAEAESFQSPPIEGQAGNSKLETGNHYFVCVAGAGLDAAVNRMANRMPRWLRRDGGYVLALPPALLSFRPQRFTLEVLDATGAAGPRFSEPAMMVAIGNAPSYGHGMRVAPRADLADGKLDVCLVRRVNQLRLLRCFPRVYRGAHLALPEVEYLQAAAVRLSTEAPLDIYADGEFVCRTPAEIRAWPRRLAVVVP